MALPARTWCFAHDPDRAQAQEEARTRGGLNSSKRARLRGLLPERLLPVFTRLETALVQVHQGDLDAKRASAMASLAGALVKVLQSGEYEERIRALEAAQRADEPPLRRVG